MGLFNFFFKHKKADTHKENDYYNLFVAEIKKANEFFEKGTVYGRTITLEEQSCLIHNCRTYHEKYLETLYDFTTIEGINRIPSDKNAVPFPVSGTPCYNLDYVLRLKATNYKKENIDLAIACLRKANELSFNADCAFEKDCMRVVEYLKDAGKFDEARAEQEFIYNTYLKKDYVNPKGISFSQCYDKDSPFYGNDLVESSGDMFVCEECAKYTKRIFSEYGKDPKYPILPKYFKENLPQHKHCTIHFNPYFEGTINTWEYAGDLIEFCNRPYTDERTAEQKEAFENEVAKRERSEIIKLEFDWLREFLPDIAPKSLSGYSRMKNLKSDKYIVIVSAAKEKGKHLIE